ncbi:hypothetical protein B566_EDAN004671 [Ephemera danica]|nr:hypothetical protein B566_EDAN004671 [Ephemera danica]
MLYFVYQKEFGNIIMSESEPAEVDVQHQPYAEPAVQVESPYLQVETTKRQLLAYETGYLTDVTIVAHNEKIHCHSQILSFASPKLAAMLGEKKEFQLSDDVDPCLIRLLLQ